MFVDATLDCLSGFLPHLTFSLFLYFCVMSIIFDTNLIQGFNFMDLLAFHGSKLVAIVVRQLVILHTAFVLQVRLTKYPCSNALSKLS